MEYLVAIFRWFHIFWGIMWIGILYWFNFVNGPFAATMDGETKKKVVPELLPRALWWFRWGAAYTWITGFLMLTWFYNYMNYAVESGKTWTTAGWILSFFFLVTPFIYDMLAKSA